jgi:hypothetical protein
MVVHTYNPSPQDINMGVPKIKEKKKKRKEIDI